MLREIGVAGVADLLGNLPKDLLLQEPLPLDGPLSEAELARKMGSMAARNAGTDQWSCFLGAGAYNHYIPSVVDALVSRSEFLTAYTPYQAELSQGTLQAVFEFQSYICLLTGREVANASLYDGSTAAAEAAFMISRITGKKRILISQGLHPEYRQVLETYTRHTPIQLEPIPLDSESGTTRVEHLEQACQGQDAPGGILLQSPNFFGCLEDVAELSAAARRQSALLGVAVAEPISMALVPSPGSQGADIVFGEGQALGVPLSYGGPYVGFFATRDEFRRHMPGRLVGRARDAKGRSGFVLTLSTREQHIRREKATSNICTNEGLCALMASIYLSAMGKHGLRQVAEQNMQKSHWLQEQVAGIPGFGIRYGGPFFNEFVVRTPIPARQLVRRLLGKGFLAGLPLDRYDALRADELLVCVTEQVRREEMSGLLEQLRSL